MNGACSYAEISLLLFPGLPLTVLDDVLVATVHTLPPAPTLPPDPPECVARYGQYLKDKYKRMSTLPDGDWPPSLGRQYTRLAMIEQERELPGAELVATMEKDYIHGNIDNIVKRKKAIQLPEIFLPTEDGGQQLKILMDGAPGVGKSTLSRKICKDWASGQLLQQYHLVILLPLRQARIREANSIEGLIDADYPDLKHQVVRHIQETCGEHVLLIVDGYDELSYKDRIQDSFFLDVVKGIKFSKCSVLVTSRPYASDYLQRLQSVNRHVEVLGFTEEQIEDCILQNIPEKAKATELVQTLKQRQDIVSLCYIPLNCAIVLYVYKMEQCILPHSLTKLYEIFIINCIKRHASSTGNDSITVGLHTLAEIPESFEKHLNALCKLAYDGLVADKMVFSVKDIKAAFPNCTDFDVSNNMLSLMTVFKEFTSAGEELSYQFLHLTIQEFLAARWAASQLSDGELLKFFKDHLREKRYRMVLLFLAGISQLSFHSTDKLHFKHRYNKEFLFFCHLIYESQNFSLFHNLATAIDGARLTLLWCYMLPFDCLVLAHFLAWCDSSLKSLDLCGCGLTDQFFETMQKVNLQHHGTTQIEEVDLSINPVVLTMLSLLPKLPVFAHTIVLKACNLQYPERVSYDQINLHHLLNMKHLTTLEVSTKEQNDGEIKCFLSLEKFQLQNGNILSQNAVDIFRSLEHNTSLEELDLSENRQLSEGDSEAVGCAIERMLNVNKTLKVLNLYGCGLTNELASYFASGLAQNHSTTKVELCSNNIGSTGAVHIFRSLEHNTSLKELDLSGNSQLAGGDSEAVGCAIERMLNVNKTLKVLNLSDCNVTDPIVKHILTGLTKNTSLVMLNVRSPKLSGSCAVSLLQQMTTHPSLSITVGVVDVLGFGWVKMDRGSLWCVIGDMIPENCVEFFRALNNSDLKISVLNVVHLTNKTAEHFAVGLAESQSIQTLKLEHCNITSAGAVSIFRSLEHNNTLEILDLSENRRLAKGDSEAVGCAIERMLNVNIKLKVLKLSGCQVTDPIVQHILTGLTKNISLVTLDMGSPKLSGSCAVSLFQQMTTHPTLSITVGEVNVLGVGWVKMDRGSLWCVIGDMIPENCVEFFRALNNSDLKISVLNVVHLTNKTAEHFAVGLAESQSIQTLKLEHCNITSAGAVNIFRSLEHNNTLEILDLSENRQLAKGDSEAVGCAIERMLNVNIKLKVLKLSGCQVTDPIVQHILTGLTKNISLVTLDMGSPKLSGSCAVSLFQQMTTHPTLSITVGEVNVLGVGWVKMDRGSLWCVIGDMIPENCVEFFRALNNSDLKISVLNVVHLTNKTAEHFAVGLAESQSIQTLKLEHCNITSAGAVSIFRSLEHNNTLEILDLSENRQLAKGDSEAVGCAIESMLNVNRTLKGLNLSGCQVTDPIVRHILTGLMKNTSLVTLDMGSLKLSGSCAVSLFQQKTTHPTLSITVGEVNVLGVGRVKIDRGCQYIWCIVGDLIPKNCMELFRALNSSGLKVPHFIVQDLTDQAAEHFAVGLAESQSFRALKLEQVRDITSSTYAVSIFRSLEHNTSLEELDLSWNSQLAEGDSEAVGCAIERMLNVNKTLKVLRLSECALDTTLVTHIGAGLAHNTSLAELNVGEDNIFLRISITGAIIWKSNNVTSEGWIQLFKALSNNTSLKNLDISHNKLGMEGSVALAEMLSCNKSLTELNLGSCDIPEAGLREIARDLLQNTSLKNLDISHNKLGMEGSVALAEMLSCNKSLTELNLGSCDIPEAGLREIARDLLQNTSLKKLDISHNKLGIEGSVALAEMLSCNKSLTELNLRWCDIPEAGLREIARGLLQNSLRTLTLYSLEGKAFLEAEIEKLKKSENFTPQSLSRLEIKY